jgi:hypothetical protein
MALDIKNNYTQWPKLVRSCKLYVTKGREGCSFHNSDTQKG